VETLPFRKSISWIPCVRIKGIHYKYPGHIVDNEPKKSNEITTVKKKIPNPLDAHMGMKGFRSA
jgi:hypothetical protein